MAYLPTNSTNTLLLANQEFTGEAVAVDKEFISVTCSFNTNVGGVLEFFHSIDGFAFSNYADIYDFTTNPGSHSIEVSVKGKYFKIRYLNGSVNQSVFNLFCKLNVTVGEAILNATYDTITVFAGGTGLNIRELTTNDKVSIPRLEQTLTSDSGVSALQCKITSMPAIVIPPITISSVNIKDSNGGDILADAGTLRVSTISGFATSANQVTAQTSLNSLVTGTRIQASNGNLITCDASNNLNVAVSNFPSGITHVYIDNDLLNVNVDNIIRTSQIINNNNYDLDLTGSTLWADSSPGFVENPQGDNGWYYQSVNTASSSNVYYYANNALFVQSNIIYNTVESIFSVIDLDYIGTEPQRNLPFLVIRTQPTGTNDYQPGFSHSVQTYIIPSTETLILNEKVLIYANIGTYSTYTPPDDLYPGIRRIKLELFSTNGSDFTTLPIGYISINTPTNSQSVRYTLHHGGFSFIKGTIDNICTWNFINSRERKAETNLSNLSVINGYLGVTGNFYPSLQSITGHVMVDNLVSVTGDFYPSLQSITGHVMVDNLVSVTGDFYPSLQSITGHVMVDNLVSVTGDFYPSLQSITGHVMVDNLVSVTGDFYPSLQSITGHVMVDNLVSVTGDFYPSLQSITGHVTVDNVVSVTGDFYPSLQSITGHVTVDNVVSVTGDFYPSLQSITGHVTVDNLVSVTGAFYPETQHISGSVSITGTPSVNANISNSSIAVTGAFYPSTQQISGTVDINNFPATQAVSGTVDSVLKFSTGQYQTHTAVSTKNAADVYINNTSAIATQDGNINLAYNGAKQAINTNIVNTSLPISFPSSITAHVSNSYLTVHNQVLHNGNWVDLVGAANGHLLVNSSTQDGDGNDIGSKQYPMGTGTANALSVNLAAQEQNVDVNIKQIQAGITAYISNPLSITGYTFTTLNNGTQLGTSNSSLNTASVMYSLGDAPGGGVGLSILESTPQGNRNNLLVYDNTTSTLVTLTNTTLNNINQSITSGNAGITALITSGNTTLNNINQSITSGNAGITGLITSGNNTLTEIYSGITSTNSKLVQQYSTTNSIIGGYNASGLNVYQILPKTKSFAMAGTNPNGCAADTLFGGTTTTLRVDTTSFGYANQKTFYGYIPSGSTLRTIAYTYVNSSGVESSTATAITATNTYTTLFTGSGINEVKFNGNVNPGTNDLVYITINNSAIVNNVGSLNIRNHYNGVFTCPSNAIAVVTSLDYNLSTAGEQLFMNIYDSSGARSSVYAGYFYQTGVNNFRASPEGIGRIIQPLESVCFSTSSTTPTSKYLYYTVLVKYF